MASYLPFFFENPLFLLFTVFHYCMLADSIRRQEYVWSFFLLFPAYFNSVMYYFSVYRHDPINFAFFGWFGDDARRIKQLEADIYHLDKAHHYQQLGDIYLKQNKLTKAEECFRGALQRDPKEIDAQAHLGVCLARQKKFAEAVPYLRQVATQNPEHDYGETLICLAEPLTALKDPTALPTWQYVLTQCTLSRARVQYAELLAESGNAAEALKQARTVVEDDRFTPRFQQIRDRPWVSRAKKLVRALAK